MTQAESVDTTTGEVAVRTPAEIMESGALPADQVELVTQFLSNALPEEEADPQAAALAIIAQVLAADSPDEVLADIEAMGLRQYLDKPFTLESVQFRRSEYEAGMPFYALIHGTDRATGEKILLTSGSQKVTAQLFRLATRGWLPREVMAKQSNKATRAGFYPVRLVDPD